MAEYQPVELDLPNNGKFRMSSDGTSLRVEMQKGDIKFQEKTTALPNHKDAFQKVGSNEELKPNDMIIIKYPDGSGYAEIITEARYEGGKLVSLKAKVPSGAEKSRNHLIAKSEYDSESGNLIYNGTWEAGKGEMSFSVIRARNSTNPPPPSASTPNTPPAPVETQDRPSPGRKLSKAEQGLSTEIARMEKEFRGNYSELLNTVVAKRQEAGNKNPDVMYKGWYSQWQNSDAYEAAAKSWSAGGQKEYNDWVDRQDKLTPKDASKNMLNRFAQLKSLDEKREFLKNHIDYLNKLRIELSTGSYSN